LQYKLSAYNEDTADLTPTFEESDQGIAELKETRISSDNQIVTIII